MKFELPDQCIICGAKCSGGGENIKFYDCGAKMWIKEIRDSQCIVVFNYCADVEVKND